MDELQRTLLASLLAGLVQLLRGEERGTAAAPGPASTPGSDSVTGPPDVAGGTGETPTADELEALVGLGGEPPAGPSDDPVLARLFPDAYRDDVGAAAEFRRYTESELRDGKLAAATEVLAQLTGCRDGRLLLGEESAGAWLATLNDLRLALGTRLAVSEDLAEDFRRLPPGDPRVGQLQVYEWLGVTQELLVRALADR